MLVPDASTQLIEQSGLSLWYRFGQALFHDYLNLYKYTGIVPRPSPVRFAGDQTNLHNGSRPCITARAVLLNVQLGRIDMHKALAFGTVIVIALAISYAMLLPPPRSDGICERTGSRTSDAEFIETAVWHYHRVLGVEGNERAVSDYLRDNPDCCKVFRERTPEVEATERSAWWGGVVVRMQRAKPQPIEGTNFLGNAVYVQVDNCRNGSEQLTEYLTGG